MVEPLLVGLGVLAAHQPTALGSSKHTRDVAVASGRLTRIRRGWYAREVADPAVVAAVRSGGCVARADALRLRGSWVSASLGRGHVRRAAHVRGRSGCSPHGPQPPVHDAAESGLETMVRVRLRSCGVAVRTQVVVRRSRVDLLVGQRLVIECDGGEHDASWQAQGADRARDRELIAAGSLVVRPAYDQIVHDWPAAERDLLALVRRGAHRAPRRRDHG